MRVTVRYGREIPRLRGPRPPAARPGRAVCPHAGTVLPPATGLSATVASEHNDARRGTTMAATADDLTAQAAEGVLAPVGPSSGAPAGPASGSPGAKRGATHAVGGDRALDRAVWLWFVVAFIGQSLFVVHIVSFYGRTALMGNFAAWNKHLSPGYVAGDSIGNSSLGMHLMMAAIITFCGMLQLIPQIRQRAPAFHRWVGRIYIPAAFLASLSALYLVLIRGGSSDEGAHHAGIVLNGVLIMVCAAMALRYALARNFAVHRRWAMRLFLTVSGVWFFRVGLFFWILVNGGRAVGFDDETFSGPALVFLSFAQYLLPLAVLEIYLHLRNRGGAVSKYALAALFGVFTLATAVGLFGYAMFIVKTGAAI
jgi:hypothetical protein